MAITGDLADGKAQHLAELLEPLRNLQAPLGTWFVAGNHEDYHGSRDWSRMVEDLGISVLDNRHVRIDSGTLRLSLAGVRDHAGRHLGSDSGSDLDAALGFGSELPTILLAHHPSTFKSASGRVDLQLSGHVHGGQVWPLSWLFGLVCPYLSGLYERNGSLLYLSRGAGFWGPPLRLGAPSEITLLTVTSQPAAAAEGDDIAEPSREESSWLQRTKDGLP